MAKSYFESKFFKEAVKICNTFKIIHKQERENENLIRKVDHKDVDKEIGKFIDDLENEGLLENTIIFYYGDHGGVLPRSKGYIYESGLNVPLVVRIPEKFKRLSPFNNGSRTSTFVEFVDLVPTVLSLAGVEIPKSVDGKPFLGKGLKKQKIGRPSD